MRADRLVAIVLLLQAHGQRTVAQLAGTLDTSERTIRRDLDALCAAGVPVYPQRGRGGGWALLAGHRIDLSGMTAGEAQSLVLAASGAPDQKGVDAALRKVVAALPPATRDQVMAAIARVHVDPTSWGPSRRPGATAASEVTREEHILVRLREALERNVAVDVYYAKPGADPSWRRVNPRGLVVKSGVWYLVGVGPAGPRTFRVSRVEALELTSEPACTPAGFDLAATWRESQRAFDALRPSAEVTVEVLVDAGAWPRLSKRLGAWWDLADLGVACDGRRKALLRICSPRQAALELAGFDGTVEVLDPPDVRAELANLGRCLVERYTSGRPAVSDSGGVLAEPPDGAGSEDDEPRDKVRRPSPVEGALDERVVHELVEPV